ncbi:MAG TPA: isoprenylcysteine carboxylmethyltransferase family protein [Firmicutes bacterium]|jgi:protein-S-isoprenylcysteine O-methyltransferase Ste14|nr:isoprenylcysteine carboxylmethyltransferase family protein [Bacillota bacterium]
METGKVLIYIVKTVLSTIAMAVILFASAGTPDWAAGWAYVGLVSIGTVASMLIVDTELLAERSQVGQGAQTIDVVLAVTMARVGPAAIAAVAGLDLRFGWMPEIPRVLSAAGMLGMILGYAIGMWAMASNKFFSGVVRIQSERGHEVVTGGPYAIVRHPGYAGTILAVLGTPLMLGSMWALIPAAATIGVIIARTALEDRTLMQCLSGYKAYARCVRCRLLPGVW